MYFVVLYPYSSFDKLVFPNSVSWPINSQLTFTAEKIKSSRIRNGPEVGTFHFHKKEIDHTVAHTHRFVAPISANIVRIR